MSKQTINNGESGSSVRSKLNANFTDLYPEVVDYDTELTFDHDKKMYHDATGESITFTIAASGNVDQVGYVIILDNPTAVSVTGATALDTSTAVDASKRNILTVVYFAEGVVYNNVTCDVP